MSREPLPLPAEPQTPHARLARRVEAAVDAQGRAAVAGVAVRLLTGATTPQDVTSGTARALLGDDDTLSPAAVGALALGTAWHHRSLPALLDAVDAPTADVRTAALLVLAAKADALRAEAAVDRTLVERVRAAAADPHPDVREAAASALGALARTEDLESVLPVLTAMVMDVDPALAAAAELALAQLAERLHRPDLATGLEA